MEVVYVPPAPKPDEVRLLMSRSEAELLHTALWRLRHGLSMPAEIRAVDVAVNAFYFAGVKRLA